MLVRRAEPHHLLDAGAVVPAAVEEHDLARRRELRDVALEVPLGRLPLGGGGQSRDAAEAGIEAFLDALDRTALACGVASLEDDRDPRARLPDPVEHQGELDLQTLQLALVHLAGNPLHRRVPIVESSHRTEAYFRRRTNQKQNRGSAAVEAGAAPSKSTPGRN